MSELYNGPRIDYEPEYPDIHYYGHMFLKHITWEGDPWHEVDKSWFDSCYIHAGISGPELTLKGPDALKLLSDCSINNVYKWKIGKCKHIVNLDDDGLITNHALFMRDAEDTFRTTAGCTYPIEMKLSHGGYNVEKSVKDIFVFQFSGPKSLTILEKLTQQSLRDVKFLDFRQVTIPGIDAEIEIYRIGMSGTLAYELHGPREIGPAVYDAAYKAGQEYGIKRMGWRDYTVNHTFGGFPQITVNFEVSLYKDPLFSQMAPFPLICTGSVEPENIRARFRNPVEVGWDWMADMDHDFVGKGALAAEMANPKRRIVSLEFNPEDLGKVYMSQFTDDPYKIMEWPCAVQQPAGGHQDYITDKDGKIIGISADPTYSSHFHTTISHAIIDVDEIEEGKEVLVKWGDYGKKIIDIKATITRYPYINDVMNNKDYDLNTVSSDI